MFRIRTSFSRMIVICLIACAMPTYAQSLEDENRIAAGYYSREQWDEAIVAFASLIERYPNSEQANVGHFFLGEALMQSENFVDAYPNYQIFLQRLPDHSLSPRATFRMGESAYRIGNYDQAIRLLEIYVRENSSESLNEFALPYLGEMRLERLEPQLAQRAYETALLMYPDGQLANKCRLGLANSLQLQGAIPEAIRFYQFILSQENNPLASEAELQLAIISVNQGDFESARPHLENALSLSKTEPSRCEASYWLARIHAMDSDFSKAFELLESVAGHEAPIHLASAIYFDGATAAINQQKLGIADQWLSNLLSEYPTSKLADKALHMKIELGRYSSDRELSVETESLTQQFIQQFPNSDLMPSVLETTGRIHYEKHEYEKSVAIFQKLLSEDRDLTSSSVAFDRANWLYLQALGQIGLKRFGAAENSLNHIDITAASAALKPLYQLALATARFGQKKYQHAIPNYRDFLTFSDQQKSSGASATLTASQHESLRARTELTICLAESGLWNEVNTAFADLQNRHGSESIVQETAEYLADKAYHEKQPVYAIRWYEMLTTPANSSATIARSLSAMGWLKIESGDAAGAQLAFDRLIKEFPDSEHVSAAAMARGKAFDDQRDYQQAAKMYGLVILDSTNTDLGKVAKLRRAYALQRLGETSDLMESKTLLQEYLALPGELPAGDEAIYQLGWVNFDLKLLDESSRNFRELRAKYPASKYFSDATFRLAQQEVQRNNLPAASLLLKSIDNQAHVPQAIELRATYLIGEIAAKEQRWADVVNTMQRLLPQTDDPALQIKANYWLAEALYRQQQFAAAGEVFGRLRIEHEGLEQPLEPWLWLRGAQCLCQQNHWPEAMQLADSAKAKFPNFSVTYEFDFILGRGLEDGGKLIDARKAYQLVIDSPSGGTTETAAIAQWRIGETFFHQENYADAIKAFYSVDSLFTYEKWRSAAMFQAGKCQEHLNNWKQAQRLYSRLIDTFPNSEYASAAKDRLERVASIAQTEPPETR